ncbi:glycosyltransferase [Lentibacillus saliphilus]|uniref:glycosyltransferase n=1 Tax=Lentibacillus saliphilus TaxID=2737028 RepID=UPI001C3005B4|nr:glycosyltransferase [Lentibacillus saliphilus]
MDEIKTKNVLILSNMYPSKHSKTYGVFVKNQADALSKRGLDIDVIAITDPRKGKFRLLRKYGWFFLKNAWHLIVHGRKYDVVHVHYIFPTGLIGILYKKLLKKKLIVTSHGGDIDQMIKKAGLARRITANILEKSDHIIAVGERLKEDMVKEFQIADGKVSVINMGVNRDIFHVGDQYEARKSLRLSTQNQILLFVGNLIRAKGLDDLIQAYQTITDTEKNIELHLIGEPKDPNYYQTIIKRLPELQSAHIHNSMPQKEIVKWMNAADVFVLPSHMEGFGLVALEAMACGLPVVGTDVGGLHYLLKDETGLLVQPHNPDELAENIKTLLVDEQLRSRIIKKGHTKAEAYDQVVQTDKVMKLYYK